MTAAPPAKPAIPDELHPMLDANEAALRALAETLGGEVRSIALEQRARWVAPTAHYERACVLEAERDGTRVAIVANALRHTSGKSGVRWATQHRVAAIRGDATVDSVLHTAEHAVPFIGRLEVPHFEWSAQAGSATESAWMLDADARALPSTGDAFRFAGCYDGVLYGALREGELDRPLLEHAIDALVKAAALPWRAPTEDERQARRTRAMGRARKRLAIGCVINLAVLGLIGWGIYALVS